VRTASGHQDARVKNENEDQAELEEKARNAVVIAANDEA
jgi:hypothetical protein